MKRDLRTSAIADALGVDAQTIRYHARKGRLPFDLTPGRQRRFNLAEVRAALARDEEPADTSLDFGLDLETPTSGELTSSARMTIAATAGYDERRFNADVLPARNFISAFAVAGSARYPQSPESIGAGV